MATTAPITRVFPGHVFTVGPILVKCCRKCGITRELERFWSDPGRPGGVMDTCSVCLSTGMPTGRPTKSRL